MPRKKGRQIHAIPHHMTVLPAADLYKGLIEGGEGTTSINVSCVFFLQAKNRTAKKGNVL